MTKAFTILTLLICTLSIKAQINTIDEKLLKKYSKKELTILKKEKHDKYKFDKYCVDNAFYIAASSTEKIAADKKSYKTIKIKDLTKINFFELNIELKQSEYQVFLISGASKILMVKSIDRILKELKTK